MLLGPVCGFVLKHVDGQHFVVMSQVEQALTAHLQNRLFFSSCIYEEPPGFLASAKSGKQQCYLLILSLKLTCHCHLNVLALQSSTFTHLPDSS